MERIDALSSLIWCLNQKTSRLYGETEQDFIRGHGLYSEILPALKGLLADLERDEIQSGAQSPHQVGVVLPEYQALASLAAIFHATAKAKGWHDKPCEAGTRLALIHAEVSELLEVLRAGNPPSPHIPMISHAEEEAADIIIRTLEFCATEGYDIARAVYHKHEYNKTRPHKHGGKQF